MLCVKNGKLPLSDIFIAWLHCGFGKLIARAQRLKISTASPKYSEHFKMTKSRIFLSFIFTLSALVGPCSSKAACYRPDGAIEPSNTACNPSRPHSMCCDPEDICLSNQLCYSGTYNRLRRGVRYVSLLNM